MRDRRFERRLLKYSRSDSDSDSVAESSCGTSASDRWGAAPVESDGDLSDIDSDEVLTAAHPS